MTGGLQVPNAKDEAMQDPHILCQGIELDAIRVRPPARGGGARRRPPPPPVLSGHAASLTHY